MLAYLSPFPRLEGVAAADMSLALTAYSPAAAIYATATFDGT